MISAQDIEKVLGVTPEEIANVKKLYFNFNGAPHLDAKAYTILLLACKIADLERTVKNLQEKAHTCPF